MIKRLLARVLGRKPTIPRPPTRLTDDEALAIAARVITLSDVLVHDVSPSGASAIWTVGTRNRGINEWVRISDATGEVIEHRRGGLR